MTKRIALIDGDALCYQSSKETLEESIKNIDEKVQNIFDKTESSHYVVFISNSPYFRHKIDPNYKSTRKKYESPLKWLKTLKAYLKERWNAQSMNLVEADDLVRYWYNRTFKYYETDMETHIQKAVTYEKVYLDDLKFYKDLPQYKSKTVWEDVEKVICSPDKDLLQSIPGKHFNYSYKLEDKDNPNSVIKGWWVENELMDSQRFRWKQMIQGDSADSIGGIKNYGEVKADKIIKDCDEIRLPYHECILTHYIKIYGVSQGIYEFQKNYRLLHLLSSDEDFMREVGKLPDFPVITEIVHDSQIENLDEKLTF